jgi:hypothetical protein
MNIAVLHVTQGDPEKFDEVDRSIEQAIDLFENSGFDSEGNRVSSEEEGRVLDAKGKILELLIQSREKLKELKASHRGMVEKLQKLEEKLTLAEKAWETKHKKLSVALTKTTERLESTLKAMKTNEEWWNTKFAEESKKWNDKFLSLEAAVKQGDDFKSEQSLLLIRQLAYSYQYKLATIFGVGKDHTKRYLMTHEQVANNKTVDQTKMQTIHVMFDPSYDETDVGLLVKDIREIGVHLSHPAVILDVAITDKAAMGKVIDAALANNLITPSQEQAAKKLLNVVHTFTVNSSYPTINTPLLSSTI